MRARITPPTRPPPAAHWLAGVWLRPARPPPLAHPPAPSRLLQGANGPMTRQEVMNMAAVLTRQKLPCHYKISIEGGRVM